MGFRDYVYSFLLFTLLVAVIFSMDLRQTRRIDALSEEIIYFRQNVKVSQDSILANVKTPVWWR